MSMHPHTIGSIPDETVRVAHAALSRGNIYLTMRDQLGTLYEDQNFAALFPKRGRPAEAPWQLVLTTVYTRLMALFGESLENSLRTCYTLSITEEETRKGMPTTPLPPLPYSKPLCNV